MLFDARPGTLASRRITPTRVVLGALVVAILQFGAWYYLLDQAHRDAERQGIDHVARDTDIVRERVERQLEALARYYVPLQGRVQARLEGRMNESFVERRVRSLLGVNSAAVVHVLFLARNPADDWETGTIPSPYDGAARAALRAAALPVAPNTIVFDPPISGPQTWLLPTRHAISGEDGIVAGIAVLTLDGAMLAASLPWSGATSQERIALWRSDGVFLTGTVEAASRIARRFTVPRPKADGRITDPLGGPERFVAAHDIDGQDLFVTVSVRTDTELTAFHDLLEVAILLEFVVVIAIAGAAAALTFRGAQRQAEAAAIRAQEQRAALNHILDGIGAGVLRIKIGAAGTFERYYFNSGAARLVRRSMAEVAAATIVMDFGDPPATETDRRRVAEELQQTGSSTYERRFLCGDGALRWMRLQLRVIARDGDMLDCVVLMTDIETEKAATAAAVSAARLAALGEVSSNLAHEMMQPLTVIALLAETSLAMLDEPRPEALPQIASQQEKILQMTHRARLVTDHLRRAARTGAGALKLTPLRGAVDGALVMCGAALRAANIAVTIDLPDDLPAILGTSELLEQVFLNLLLNARDALVESEVADRRIVISGRAEQDRVIVRITDSGPGIPPAILGRMFEQFFTTKPADRGTGLGLSICAGIVAAAGGTIAATNAAPDTPLHGAEFVLALRTAPLPAEPARQEAA